MLRYLLLIVLNAPIILVGLASVLTSYKMHRITTAHFRGQFIFWLLALLAVVFGFPAYNAYMGFEIWQIQNVSLLNIVLSTAVIYLIYAATSMAKRLEQTERNFRQLHQALSIRLSLDKPGGDDGSQVGADTIRPPADTEDAG